MASKSLPDHVPSKAIEPEPGHRLSWFEMGEICEAMVTAPRALRAATRSIVSEQELGQRAAYIIGMIGRGTVHPRDLAQRMRIGPSLMTAELNRLTEAGLITSSRSPTDRRRLEFSLTAEGKALHVRFGEGLEKFFDERFAAYSREDLMLFARMLDDFARGAPSDDEG